MGMPGRTWQGSADQYRYSHNGHEKEDEVAAGDYDFGARFFDSRIGRWMSRDAVATKYPDMSPYNFALNNPILFFDDDGNDVGVGIKSVTKQGNKVVISLEIKMNLKLVNLSNKNISSEAMESFKKDLADYASGTFSGDGKDLEAFQDIEYKIDFKLNITEAKSMNDIKSSDHVMAIVNEIPKNPNTTSGYVDPVGLTNTSRGSSMAIESKLFDTDNLPAKKAALHEIGHSLVLGHREDIKNLMYESLNGGWDITDEQRHTIALLGFGVRQNAKAGQSTKEGGVGAGLKEFWQFIKDNNIDYTPIDNGKSGAPAPKDWSKKAPTENKKTKIKGEGKLITKPYF